MKTLLLSLTFALSTLPLFAQAPPNPFPIAGRIVRFGYDALYPTIPGDLIGIAGSPVSAQNNGVIVALPSRNVQFQCGAGVYTAEVWSQSLNNWVQTVWGDSNVAYYPIDNFGHSWITCATGTTAFPLSTNGVLRCHGIDGTLQVPGDLQPGSNNGVLFSVLTQDMHIIEVAKVYHGRIYLGSTYGWVEAVYPVGMCDYDPQP